MHTFSETAAGVPAFLAKLWRLVDDPDTNNLICWSKDGRSFIIQNQAQFARELLPLNYKHNNMASFIRQLNMYGFHKITSIDNGGLKFDRDEMEFSHPCFKRNCPYLLEHIKRKIATTKTVDEKAAFKPEAVTKVLQDVKAMRGRQDSLDSRFSVMKQENEALWREIASLRQKHAKQQQIVNKLIQFLITIVQPSRNMSGVKRHMQLMINDIPENGKMRKDSESESDCGPVIHELGEELLDCEVDDELMVPHSPYAQFGATQREAETPSPLHPERPHSNISQASHHYDYSNQSAEDALNAAVSASNNGATLANNAAAAAAASSIIQSVCPDGSSIVYHVTEVPDASEGATSENITIVPTNYNEDNVLTTPLVRQQMARTQQLRQKNKQRRKESDEANQQNCGKTAKLQQRQEQQQQQPSLVKIESENNPLAFLNVYADERVATPDPNMISPNLSEDASRLSPGVGLLGATANAVGMVSAGKTLNTENADAMLDGTGNISNERDFFNTDGFITGEMPTNIFEDSLLAASDNSNFNDNFKLNQQEQEQQQQQPPQPQSSQQNYLTTSGGKFSPYLAASPTGSRSNINNNNVASTSAAAAAAAAAANVISPTTSAAAAANGNNSNSGKRVAAANQGKNGNDMTVVKYKNEEVMRDEVHGHLENVQDELNSLKDLLQSDSYSLDANTLLGDGTTTIQNNNRLVIPTLDGDFLNKLFTDNDILGPYGISLANELHNDKKGSELMTYQPMYDLSDIMSINDKNELENNSSNPTPSSSRQLQQQRSVLNTPHHN